MTATRVSPWIPVVLWGGLIFALSSIPSLGTGLGTWDLVLRKLGHFGIYAVLGALLWRAVRQPAAALLLASAYAVTDELHQGFVSGRSASALDWLIDTAGAAAGVLVASRGGSDRFPASPLLRGRRSRPGRAARRPERGR